MVHGLCVVHLIDVAESLDGEEQQLAVSVVHLFRECDELSESVALKTCKLVAYLSPLACLDVVCRSVEHLSRHAASILAVEVEDACSLVGLRLAKLLCAEFLWVVEQVGGVVAFRVPCEVHEEGDGIFHWLEVAHVQHPKLVNAILISQRQLVPDVLYRSDVQPLAVAWRAHVVHVVVHAEAALVLTLLGGGQTSNVAPVVVAEEDDHVVGHLESLVVISLYLFI